MAKPTYWQKNDPKKPLFEDLVWNIPDQPTGKMTVVGGNSQSFATPVRAADYLAQTFPLQAVTTVLPDSLQKSVPPLENIQFTPSTQSGSFAESDQLTDSLQTGDSTLLIGDFSKNAATAKALAVAIKKTETPLLITRDTVDLLLPHLGKIIDKTPIFYLATLAQIQKIFQNLYYPKMLSLSMPLLQLVEALHKFTLSYPCTIITFHEQQIVVANAGKITTTSLEMTAYVPLTLWGGQLASHIAALNLYTPGQALQATTAALCYQPKKKDR